MSQESRGPGRGIGGSRFRLSCIGTIRVDEVPGWAESGQYISVRRSSVEATVGDLLYTPDGGSGKPGERRKQVLFTYPTYGSDLRFMV